MRSSVRVLVLALVLLVTSPARPAVAAVDPDPAWTPPAGSAMAELLEGLPEDERRDRLRDLLDLDPTPHPPRAPSTRCGPETCLTVSEVRGSAPLETLPRSWIRCVGEVGPASSWAMVRRWFTTAACLGDVVTEDSTPR